MMSCERAKTEEYRIVVAFPKSLSARFGECWTGIGRACRRCCILACYFFLALFVVAISLSFCWIIILVSYCQKSPGLGLEDVSIRDMVIYQNTTMATTDTPWQVTSNINVDLSTWNPNTVAGCFTTYRRMVVQVQYKGQRILQQEVPLGFGLKPRRSRPVMLDLQGDQFPLQRDLGSLLKLELQNATAVEFQFSFDVRYMRNDRKAGWTRMACDVIAKTPANINSSQVTATSNLVWSSCEGN